ncbi:LEM3/CDC50 family protein [Peziza echinospora]|nr:LEM3/CDC50 family protein [Peziza echinospora]
MLDSADNRDGDDGSKKKEKSRRPGNTAFRQQRLKAWQPILTPKTVLPLFFIVGIIFAPIGGLLLWASSQVQEIIIDYTNCATTSSNIGKLDKIPSSKISTAFKSKTPFPPPRWGYFPNESSDDEGGVCSIEFTLPNELPAPVFFYYRLTNFYQNHRRYVKSVEERQLKGEAVSLSSLESSDACSPLIKDPVSGKPYYPCGLIANSLFNDTFTSPLLTNVMGNGANNETYEMTEDGIAWASDKARYKKTKYKPDEIMPPPNWQKKYPKYTDENPPPDLSQREDLQVWMRTAGLPTFSKLAKKNTKDPMREGTYLVNVTDNFNVKLYGGTKSIVITTTTVIGGKNPFLGIAYVIVGGLCVLLGTIFAARHLIKPRKLGDHTYLSWNNDQPSTATATGTSIRGDAP